MAIWIFRKMGVFHNYIFTIVYAYSYTHFRVVILVKYWVKTLIYYLNHCFCTFNRINAWKIQVSGVYVEKTDYRITNIFQNVATIKPNNLGHFLGEGLDDFGKPLYWKGHRQFC